MRNRHWLASVPKHLAKIKSVLLLAGLIPLAELFQGFLQDSLGYDPLDRITRSTGNAALILLLVTLSITPLRSLLTTTMIYIRAGHGKRASDWNWVIKLRRMLGLLSFFYATLHLGIYCWLDQGGNLAYALRDISERPFLAIGTVSFLMLVPLALTANDYSMRLLGKKWRSLHRLVYPIAILAIIHYWMLMKTGVNDPVPYALILICLLGWRIRFAWVARSSKINDGMEIPERNSSE